MIAKVTCAALAMAAAVSAGSPAGAAPFVAGTPAVPAGVATAGYYGEDPYYDPYFRGPPGVPIQVQPQQPITPSRHCRWEVVEVIDPYTGEIRYEERKVCPLPRL